jgi:urease accessory protein
MNYESGPAVLPARSPTRTGGDGYLQVRQVGARSVVTRALARSPLKLLTPRHTEKAAWVYTSTFGGGLVAGDRIELHADIGPGATCVLGTQSQTKVYRSIGSRGASQSIAATVHDDATLLCMPDATALFADSIFTQRQQYALSETASLLWLDWFTSGRRARGERWKLARFESRAQITVGKKLMFKDALLLDAADGPIDAAHRMGACDCFATVVMIGPKFAAACDELLQWIAAQPARVVDGLIFSAGAIPAGGVIRVAGPGSESVGRWLTQRLAFAADVAGAAPWARKW